jgi:Rps23 Pro-64 3,4-dihydroxylase Tpa1-like proline 4-hydroxylase
MLNPDLDVEALSAEYSRAGRIVIRDAFDAGFADRVHVSLRDEVPWRLSVYDNRRPPKERALKLTAAELDRMGPQARTSLQREVFRQANSQFQYAYQSFDLLEGFRNKEQPSLFLYRLMEYLAGEAFFAFARTLIDDTEINRIDGHATCYTAGHFLKDHADESPFEQRRAAYVVGMTKNWTADMGGLLMFLDEEGRVEETFLPDFNTLTVFSVPVPHVVSYVPEWVRKKRLSVTGWLTVLDR